MKGVENENSNDIPWAFPTANIYARKPKNLTVMFNSFALITQAEEGYSQHADIGGLECC